jgi:hypothetical protein
MLIVRLGALRLGVLQIDLSGGIIHQVRQHRHCALALSDLQDMSGEPGYSRGIASREHLDPVQGLGSEDIEIRKSKRDTGLIPPRQILALVDRRKQLVNSLFGTATSHFVPLPPASPCPGCFKLVRFKLAALNAKQDGTLKVPRDAEQ